MMKTAFLGILESLRRIRFSTGRQPFAVLVLCLFSLSSTAFAQNPDAPDFTGTAFFVSKDGIAVTNHHVVQQAGRILLFNTNTGNISPARVVLVDPGNDLALLQADVGSKPLPVASSFSLKRGEEVMTLGYPKPFLQGVEQKATFGRVNAITGVGDDIRFAQVDVPLQPGNSGGPLLNARGEVVGIVTSGLRGDYENVAYAVKVDYLRPLLANADVSVSSSRRSSLLPFPRIVENSENSVVMVLGYKGGISGQAGAVSRRGGQNAAPQRFPDLATMIKEAERGNAKAQNALGTAYGDGQNVPKDEYKAVEWFQKAADQGDAWGQYNLGLMYFHGRGVPRDTRKAAEWFRKAADQGNAWAQYNLGLMYASGRGVTKDEIKAVEWYQKAADQGFAMAQFNLGWMYDELNSKVRFIQKNNRKAVEWYQKAADQEHMAAQYILGAKYYHGEGVIRDRKKGCALWRRAAEQGMEEAINEYNKSCSQ
jgi:hypothetical protein